MAVTVHLCVTGQAVLTQNEAPLAVYELAYQIGVVRASQFRVRHREYEERLRRDALTQRLPREET